MKHIHLFNISHLVQALKMRKEGATYAQIGAWIGGDNLSIKERQDIGIILYRKAKRMEERMKKLLPALLEFKQENEREK